MPFLVIGLFSGQQAQGYLPARVRLRATSGTDLTEPYSSRSTQTRDLGVACRQRLPSVVASISAHAGPAFLARHTDSTTSVKLVRVLPPIFAAEHV